MTLTKEEMDALFAVPPRVTKPCTKCGVEMRMPRHAWCRTCRNIERRKWHALNPGARRLHDREYYQRRKKRAKGGA